MEHEVHQKQPMGIKYEFQSDKSLRSLKCLLSRRQVEQVVGGILDVAIGCHKKAARPRCRVLNNFTLLRLEYRTLCLTGGVWARGHWVPASSLAYGGTLQLVLTSLERTEDRSEWLSISARLVDYFVKGEFKPIT
jgi:hypothetical protein